MNNEYETAKAKEYEPERPLFEVSVNKEGKYYLIDDLISLCWYSDRAGCFVITREELEKLK